MILDHISHAYLYHDMHPLFRKAFDYLTSHDFSQIENGMYEVDEQNLFAIVNSYDTEPVEARFWEGHKKYIDIQYMVSGTENMGYVPLHQARVIQPYDDEKDFTKFEGVAGSQVTVAPGYFTVFYPTDVHMPNLVSAEGSMFVKKVVMKVRIPEPVLSLTLASNNAHKLEEIRHQLAGSGIEVLSLQESGIHEELPETGNTLEANAFEKANRVYSKFGKNCFADDSGLEVEALQGAPGVYSAMYAGDHASYADNVKKLLEEMKGKTNRKAKFRTVISLVLDATEYRFEGEIAGHITEAAHGSGGFGYDPVFVPEGYETSFAEMSPEMKNRISHRGKAVEKLVKFLKDDFLQIP